MGKATSQAQRTRGTNFKGVGGFCYMSVFLKKKTRGITHDKENDMAGPDQPAEGVEDTL